MIERTPKPPTVLQSRENRRGKGRELVMKRLQTEQALSFMPPCIDRGPQMKPPAGAPTMGTRHSLLPGHGCHLCTCGRSVRHHPNPKLLGKLPGDAFSCRPSLGTASPKVTPLSRGSQYPMSDQHDGIKAKPHTPTGTDAEGPPEL